MFYMLRQLYYVNILKYNMLTLSDFFHISWWFFVTLVKVLHFESASLVLRFYATSIDEELLVMDLPVFLLIIWIQFLLKLNMIFTVTSLYIYLFNLIIYFLELTHTIYWTCYSLVIRWWCLRTMMSVMTTRLADGRKVNNDFTATRFSDTSPTSTGFDSSGKWFSIT